MEPCGTPQGRASEVEVKSSTLTEKFLSMCTSYNLIHKEVQKFITGFHRSFQRDKVIRIKTNIKVKCYVKNKYTCFN